MIANNAEQLNGRGHLLSRHVGTVPRLTASIEIAKIKTK